MRSIFTVCYVLLYSQLIKIIFLHVSWENPLVDSIGKIPPNGHYMRWLTPCLGKLKRLPVEEDMFLKYFRSSSARELMCLVICHAKSFNVSLSISLSSFLYVVMSFRWS